MASDKDPMTQFVITDSYVPRVLELIHDTVLAGHPGKKRTLSAARKSYFWSPMRKDIDAYVAKCLKCAQHTGTLPKPAPILEYPPPERLWTLPEWTMPLVLILLLAQIVQLTLFIPIVFVPGINKFLSFVPDMLAYAFFLNSILAHVPAHLKPGALTAHLGRVFLVEDVIWVRYPYTALNEIPSGLREIAENLNKVLEELENAIPLGSALLVPTR